MGDLIIKAAREIGIESRVMVKEDQLVDLLVTVKLGTKAVQGRIRARLLMEVSLDQVKIILSDMNRMAERM